MAYQRCSRCIMDNKSDQHIRFDQNGVCNYCEEAFERMKFIYKPNYHGQQELQVLLNNINTSHKFSKYSSLMGISGGIDSSYLVYLGATKWNLDMAVLHVDDGFDSEITKQNIKNLCNAENIRLINIFPDSDQYNNLILAYIKAGVPNLAAPQDNILFAFLYNFAKKNKIPYFLSGGNFASESILQKGNSHPSLDLRNIKDIHKNFGTIPINKLRFTSFTHKAFDMFFHKIKTVRPLDLLYYNRELAMAELSDYCGFLNYGGKHLENYLTAFIQNIWFPEKFGVDKRISHFSSLIVSGQMTRAGAIEEIKKPLCTQKEREFLIDFVSEKLNISKEELIGYIRSQGHQHNEYKTNIIYPVFSKIRNAIKKK